MFWMMGHITEILNKSVIIEIKKKIKYRLYYKREIFSGL